MPKNRVSETVEHYLTIYYQGRVTMNRTIVKTKDHLADFTRDRRLLMLSLMAVVIGVISAVVAYILVWLIAVITNLAFYQTFSAVPTSPANHQLGYWVILVPTIGGLIIGLMA